MRPPIVALVLFAALASAPAPAAPCAAPDHTTRVTGRQECLVVKTFKRGESALEPTLYVLLHGNHTSGSPAISLYRMAEELAVKGAPGTVALALIRPGYNDDEGSFSSGNAAGRNDNFTAANIDIVADAVARLKAFHKARRLVLLGHSGGAAMAGVILGRHPGLADAAVVLACPCDVPAWRALRGRSGAAWASESAIRYVDRIPAGTRVTVLIGERDNVTPPVLSRDYAAALAKRGLLAELSILQGRNHVDAIDAPAVIEAAMRMGLGN